MKRTLLVLTAFATLAAAGCNLKPASDPSPSATGGPSPTATASPSPSAGPTITPTAPSIVQLTTDGAGVYTLGKTLTTLESTPGLTEVTTGSAACPNNTFAKGKGGPPSPNTGIPIYEAVELSFRQDGRLYLVVNKSDAIPTPNGIYLGFTREQVENQYKNLTQIPLTQGTKKALLVRTITGGAIMFEFDAGERVTAMTAGEPTYLQNTFTAGQPFC